MTDLPTDLSADELALADLDHDRVVARGRRLHRRRLLLAGGLPAGFVVAAIVIALAVVVPSQRSQTVVTGPPSGSSGVHSVFLRPVYCELPAASSDARPVAVSEATCATSDGARLADTPSAADTASSVVLLPSTYVSFRCVLGPADLSPSDIKGASVVPDPAGGFAVLLELTGAGTQKFELVAAQRYASYVEDPTDPPFASLEALEVDGTVAAGSAISSPNETAVFSLSGLDGRQLTDQQAHRIAAEIDQDLAG